MNKISKAIISLVLCVCFVVALSACGRQNNSSATNNTDKNVSSNNAVTDNNINDSTDNSSEKSTAGDSNILVAYFSWSGNTQQVANWATKTKK